MTNRTLNRTTDRTANRTTDRSGNRTTDHTVSDTTGRATDRTANGTMSVPEAIRTRRTVRHYRPDPVSPELLDTLLDLAVEAPTSWNLQDRSIVVVSGEEGRAGLARATGGQPQPSEAPVVLVFVAEPQAWREDRSDVYRQARQNGAWSEEFVEMFSAAAQEFQEGLEQRGLLREYAVKDAVIAASFVMLAATGMGLATSPMNGWDEEEVKKVIGIEHREDLAIALLVAVGHPAGTRFHPGRRPRRRVVFEETWGAHGG
ncbi:Nitroreductase [Streptomyces sp. TLI_053]|uniref:nitroreductase family protein n=1 Tax=Streptomyces sp. TLI_053 TaxID=1855352 RepID=UPI00087D4516|nr:nitroreductase family protein [Streptomyces sp. TLI_053]SDT82858.1 Nitroreductase [Streptomyces sp. TLI_053]